MYCQYKSLLYTAVVGFTYAIYSARILSSGPGCNTTYRPNYYVSNTDSTTSVREYYKGVPIYVEVTRHSYVEEELVQLFRHQMAFSQ